VHQEIAQDAILMPIVGADVPGHPLTKSADRGVGIEGAFDFGGGRAVTPLGGAQNRIGALALPREPAGGFQRRDGLFSYRHGSDS
jgi:hypothetical protein